MKRVRPKNGISSERRRRRKGSLKNFLNFLASANDQVPEIEEQPESSFIQRENNRGEENDNLPDGGDDILSSSDRGDNHEERNYPRTLYDPFNIGVSRRNVNSNSHVDSGKAFFCDEDDPITKNFKPHHENEIDRFRFIRNEKRILDGNLDLKSKAYSLSKKMLKNISQYESVFGIHDSRPFLPLNERNYGRSGEELFAGSTYKVRDLHIILSHLHTQKSVSRIALDAILGGIDLLFGDVDELEIPKTYEAMERACHSLTSRIRVVPFCPFCQSFIVRNLENEYCEECKKLIGKRNSSSKIEWLSVVYTHPFPQLISDYIHRDVVFREHLIGLGRNLDYLEWTESRFGEKLRNRIEKSRNPFEKVMYVIATLSADKVSLFKSGIKKSVKPYSFQIDNLPENLRYKYHYIFSFLIVPPQENCEHQLKNPNIPLFVFLVQWRYMKKMSFNNFKVNNFLRSTVYDTPEAAEQCLQKQHNAKCGCYKCRKKGTPLPRIGKAPTRFDQSGESGVPKTLYHAFYSMQKYGDEEKRGSKDNPSISILCELFEEDDLFYDYLRSNTTDIMHLISLLFGVVNDKLNNPFRSQVSEFVIFIKYLREGGRRLRSMNSSGSWKYREKLNFFLYYFSLFVDISSVNLNQRNDIQRLSNKIKEAIVNMKRRKKSKSEELYSILQEIKSILITLPEYTMTTTGHVLFEHVADNEEETGPQFGKSAEPFESFYSIMRRLNGRTGVALSIMKIILTYYENHLTRVSFPKDYPDDMKVYLNKHFNLRIPKEKFNDESKCIVNYHTLACSRGVYSKQPGIYINDLNTFQFLEKQTSYKKITRVLEYESIYMNRIIAPFDSLSYGRIKKSSNSLVLISFHPSDEGDEKSVENRIRNVLVFNLAFKIGRLRKIYEVTGLNESGIYTTSCAVVFREYKVVGIKKNSKTLVVDMRLGTKDFLSSLESVKCHCQIVPEVRKDYLVEVVQSLTGATESNQYQHNLGYLTILYGM